MKVRADQLLVTRDLAPSRTRAQALILAGKVYVGETRIDKAGMMLAEDAEIFVRGEDHPYVSRGGVKLAGALDAFSVDPTGKRCLDLGASTGGFTDCLLQRGRTRRRSSQTRSAVRAISSSSMRPSSVSASWPRRSLAIRGRAASLSPW
ncbi:MAG: binding methyltransferase FtsJ like protein [Labilithrix sp.]|nr:binding methyltransferase FtsJ like protein [Labilithrix sp.]